MKKRSVEDIVKSSEFSLNPILIEESNITLGGWNWDVKLICGKEPFGTSHTSVLFGSGSDVEPSESEAEKTARRAIREIVVSLAMCHLDSNDLDELCVAKRLSDNEWRRK